MKRHLVAASFAVAGQRVATVNRVDAPRLTELATALPVGGVAACMLAEKLFEGHRDSGLGSTISPGTRGLESGMFGDPSAGNEAARELEQRPVDIGSGEGDVDVGLAADGDGW